MIYDTPPTDLVPGMGDYDFKPAGSLKLKGVKDKTIKKTKKDKPKKDNPSKSASSPPREDRSKDKEEYVIAQTEAERRFDEIQRQRVLDPGICFWLCFCGLDADGVDGEEDREECFEESSGEGWGVEQIPWFPVGCEFSIFLPS